MSSAKNIQLVKWTLPAFALIVGYFWYKRRRVDRADPGGALEKFSRPCVDDKKISTANDKNDRKANLNHYDSGIHIDDSYAAAGVTANGEESRTGTPRRVSQSLDIPGRRFSGTQQIIIKTRKSNDDKHRWHDNIDDIMNLQTILLGSNPKTLNYDISDPIRDEMTKKSVKYAVATCQDNCENKIKGSFERATEKEEKASPLASNENVTTLVDEHPDVLENCSDSCIEKNCTDSCIEKNCSDPRIVENCTDSRVGENCTDSRVGENCTDSRVVKNCTDSRVVENCTDSRVVENCSDSCVEQQSMSDTKLQGQVASCERDSANHSPISGVLEGSVTDEIRSEGSTDSGKGGSIKEHAKDKNPTSYEFLLHRDFVGRLIGKSGSFIRSVNTQACVNVAVKSHPMTKDRRICVITGTPDCIKIALKMIRQKFPKKDFPSVTLEEVSILMSPEEIPWISELMHLPLVAGVNNDVIVCHILRPDRLFVQLPTHPTYPSLRILDQNMTQLYDNVESPPVPDELMKGMLVVAKWYDRWVRAYVENPDPSGQQNLVRLVDHGGYWSFGNAEMRKIRSDYLTLPFQAIEVSLAHIQPIDGEWNQEAYDVVAQICSGSIGQAQIEGYIDADVYVSLYINIPKHGVISIADELVARGYAMPVTLEDAAPPENFPIA